MSRRKNIPKRKVEEVPDIDTVLKEIRQHVAESRYPNFQLFRAELAAYYVFDSKEAIPELMLLFGDRKNNNGTKNREWFGNQICNWTVYYKIDVDTYKKEIIDLINVGCKLLDIGLEVKLSKIENAGYGLFTTKKFKEDSIITRYGGYYCDIDIFETYAKPKSEASYLFVFPEGWGISGILNSETCFKLGFSMGRWVNSSKQNEQNVIPDYELRQNNPPMVVFRAKRDIEAGEELYWWYGNFYAFTDRCIVCSKVSGTKCEACEIPICGLSCHDKHIEKVHQEN
jgi:hypothetical protein